MSARDTYPEYGVWATMKMRCNNPNTKSYPNYGGRGIKVCPRWERFHNFYEDMGPRPDGGMLERIDNDGNYEPSNCRWALRLEQANNKTSNHTLTVDEETLNVSEWARRLGCVPSAILYRLRKGWSEKDAVTVLIPERPNSKLTMKQATEIRRLVKTHSYSALAPRFGVTKTTIRNIALNKIFK